MRAKHRITGECSLSCGGKCCRVLGVPLEGSPPSGDGRSHEPDSGWRIDSKARTVTVQDRERSPSFVHFMATRGATFDPEKRTMTVPYDDAPTPITLTLYGPAHMRVLMLASTCPQLNPDSTCRLHGTPDLPATCANYPLAQDDLLPGCTYTKEPA